MTQEKQKIEYRAVESLIPCARNSRTHSADQVAQIAASIKEFGFTNPILIDRDGGIIAGHGRVMGARKLGMDKVPCIKLGHLTDVQRRAYIIADNKLALNAGWDDEALMIEMQELADFDFDTELTGFTQEEIDALFNEGEAEPMDTTPQLADGLSYKVIINCDSEQEQGRLIGKMESEGYKCQALIS